MKGKILLIDTLHPSFKSTLEQQGFVCDEGYAMSKDEILSIIKEYNGVAIRSRFKIDADFLSKASHLKFIARGGAGMENIDAEAAAKYGINLINDPEGNRDAVGEHAIGMLLAMMNHLIRVDKEVRLGIWKREENRGDEIQGKTIGIKIYTAINPRIKINNNDVLLHSEMLSLYRKQKFEFQLDVHIHKYPVFERFSLHHESILPKK